MHKTDVSFVSTHPFYCYIVCKKSDIKTTRRLHPLQAKVKMYQHKETVKGIQIGDIVRNDTLPFMTRPSPIFKTDKNDRILFDKNLRPIKLYKPFKLESGYWVLRKEA